MYVSTGEILEQIEEMSTRRISGFIDHFEGKFLLTFYMKLKVKGEL
jgi:hypothetical protein